MGNLDELRHIKWTAKFKPETLDKEAKKFKELNSEAAFLIRALFFLLFGFLIDAAEVLNPDTFLWAIAIVCLILVFRIIQLRTTSLPLGPLLFIAPRGLITILLFLSIDPAQRIPLVNNSLVIQIIILSALLMMGGMITNKK